MKVFVTILCLSVAGLCHGQLSGSVQGSASIPGLSTMGNMISNAMSVGKLAANAGLNMAQRGSDAAFSGLNQGHRAVSDMKTNAIQQGTQGVVQGISVGASLAGNVPIVGEPLRQAIQSKADVASNIGASIQNMHGQFSTATGNMITSAQGKVNSGISAMAASINNGIDMAQNAVSTGVNAAGNMAAQGQALATGGINAGMNAAGSAAAQGQAAMSGAMQTGAALAGSVQSGISSGINAGANAAGSMAAQGQAAMNDAVERGTAAAGSVQSGINAGVNAGVNAAGTVVSQAQSTSTGAGTGSSGSQSTWSALAGRLASSLTG